MAAGDEDVCARILKLSEVNRVEPLPVVALLALHALVDMNFPMLRVWVRVADRLRDTVAGPTPAPAH